MGAVSALFVEMNLPATPLQLTARLTKKSPDTPEGKIAKRGGLHINCDVILINKDELMVKMFREKVTFICRHLFICKHLGSITQKGP